MGFQADLLNGIGQLLETAGVGKWSPAGGYAADDVMLTVDQLPTGHAQAVAMGFYPVEDSAGTDSIVGIQFWIRGKPKDRLSSKSIADSLFDALHGIESTSIAGIPIMRVWRQSGANLGPDGNDRQELSENYYLQLTRTGTHRSD